MANTIADMLAMETAAPDKTLTALDVFEEKSKDADDAIEYGMGLSQAELLDIAMSVTPMGRAKAGKGVISFLKGLLGKAKSKAKFPVGYGELTKRPISELGLSDEAIGLRNLLLSPKTKEPLQKGMRKVGVRVKDKIPDPDEYGGVWTDYITPEDVLK